MGNHDFVLKIGKLYLKNFRGLEDIEISFEERLTVLIGDNGSGKTTILDAIAGCLRYLVHQIRKLPLEEPFSKSDISIGMDDLDISLNFKGILAPFTLTANYTKNKSTTGYHSERMEVDSKRMEVYSEEDWTLERHLTELYEQEDRNLPVIAYYPARYAALTSDKVVTDDILYRFTTYEHALDKEVMNFRTLKKWLVNQSNLEIYGESDEDNRIVQTIKEALVGEKGILNEDDDRRFTDFRVSFKGTNGADGNFLFTKQDKKIYDYQLSSGERMLMLLVADLARRVALANPFSKNPLQDATGVVLLDEIDLHLHPRWQRKVLLKMMDIFPKIQFIVATHSPIILSELYSMHIRSIEKGKVYGVRDTFGHDDASDMLQIMGVQSVTRQKIKQIHRLLQGNKVVEAQNIRNTIITEGTFTPLLEIDLFIQRKLKRAS